jgi:hypothetical protein
VAGGQAFAQLAAGGSHTCALGPTGAAFCWGLGLDGQLGNRANTGAAAPVAVIMPPGVTFTALAAGGAHTCGLTAAGAAWCWGANQSGQLGSGSRDGSNAPVRVAASLGFSAIAAGLTHTCAVAASGGAIHCWGANTVGQLGTGTTTSASRPEAVIGGLTFTTVVAGDQHTCALEASGATYCWGAGRAGQLGNGQNADSPRPVLVTGGHTFRTLSAGALHSCGTTAGGVTWCWGDDAAAQLSGRPARASAVAVPVLARPAPRLTGARASTPAPAGRDNFDDGDFTAGPAWQPDSGPAGPVRLSVVEGALRIAREPRGGAVHAAGVILPVRVPVGPGTAIRFDVLVARAAPDDCGPNCAVFPAAVRVRVRNFDQSESEVWYGYTTGPATSRSLGSVVVVAHGDVPAGRWLRAERYLLRDALPRADTIVQVWLGGSGTEFEAGFDNVWLPTPGPAGLTITPDTVVLPRAGATGQLAAAVRDSAGAAYDVGTITWSTGDTLVARVNDLGLVTAVGGGRTVITARGGGVRGSATAIVRGPRARPAPRRPRRP